MTRSLVAGIVLAVCAPLTLPLTAEAQLGGLIKKKVTEAIKKPAEPAKPAEQKPAESSSQSAFSSDVLEITQPAFDAVIRGLNAELRLQEEFRRELAKYPTPEEYEACKARAAQSPEGAKIMAEYSNMPEKITPEDLQRRIQNMTTGMEALIKKVCPNDPNVWNPYNRAQKLDSIHVQAAEAAGMAASTASLPDERGTFIPVSFVVEPFIFRGGRLASLTGRQYSVLVERIERGCELNGAPPGIGARTAPAPNIPPLPGMKADAPPAPASPPAPSSGAPGGVKVPGVGNNVYWVFTGVEMGVLTPPNCRRFADLSKLLMK